MLRLLSYALDRCRTAPASANADYSLVNCVSHAFYAPLFVSGPTMRFDAYISAVRGPRAATQDDAAGAVDRPPPAASVQVAQEVEPVQHVVLVGGQLRVVNVQLVLF